MSRNYLHPGPIDRRLLTYQSEHRSESIWGNPTYNSFLSCAHYDGSAYRNRVNDDRVDTLLQIAGFYGVSRLGQMKIDHALITALVERWRPEVHAFHLPFGEVTITLQDVEVLLGLKIDGQPLIGILERPKAKRFVQLQEFLGITPPENVFSVSLIQMTALEQDPGNLVDAENHIIEQYTRRLIMQILGGLLFPDTTKSKVRLCYIDFIEDLHVSGQFSWGSAVLAFLYRSLCRATHYSSASLGGCLVLMQLWAWERFAMLRPEGVIIHDENDDTPYGARWACPHTWSMTSTHTVTTYRDQLDRCQIIDFTWLPYNIDSLPTYCRAGRLIWTARVPLIFFFAVEWHLPDRVCRQFDGFQDIPQDFQYDKALHKLDGRTKNEHWEVVHAQYIAIWNDRLNYIIHMVPTIPHASNVNAMYSHWFYQYGRRLIGNPEHHQPEGYLQTAPSLMATVEALRHINLYGEAAIEHGEGGMYTNMMRQVARDELVRLQYGYVLDFPRNEQDQFGYEPVYQVRRPDRRRDGNRRGGPRQGGRRRRRDQVDDERNADVQGGGVQLLGLLPGVDAGEGGGGVDFNDDNGAQFDSMNIANDLSDVTQAHTVQPLSSHVLAFNTIMGSQFTSFESDSSSQVPPIDPLRGTSNSQVTEFSFPHIVQDFQQSRDGEIEDATQAPPDRYKLHYERRFPSRNKKSRGCSTD